MKLDKNPLANVVAEASQKMSDPNYSSVLVGGFVERQQPATQFITAHSDDLGGPEGVINVVFHCALVIDAFRRGGGNTSRILSFDDLDAAAQGDPVATLATQQPTIHEFVEANVEHPISRKLVAIVSLGVGPRG